MERVHKEGYLSSMYGHSLGLLVDLYHLTMAYGFWKRGMTQTRAAFHLFFRRRPFGGEFAISAGLEIAMEYVRNFHFSSSDLAFLATLKHPDGKEMFETAFLDYLSTLRITCDIDAMPEGTPVFPYEPILRVEGPIIEAQLLESPFLNIINFQTLIATKASRICWAAKPDPVVEFGLRRAQGIDGALSAARAAYIGGCESTSNVLAAEIFGIPVKGTHAHSWIMAFDEEKDAFDAFAEVMPQNCIFLVDTYDTLRGVRKAIDVVKKRSASGAEMLGVRLDSGDLAYLSIQIRKLLDEEGFPNAKIMASNELDEYIINDLKRQGAQIDIWGVGTNLVTAKDQPALDGVYKLSAVQGDDKQWQYRVKLSEQMIKMTNPGILQVRRFFDKSGLVVADAAYDVYSPLPTPMTIVDTYEPHYQKTIDENMAFEDLLVPILRSGKNVYQHPSLPQIQKRVKEQLEHFQPGMRRFLYPQRYFYGLEHTLFVKKLNMIEGIKRKTSS